MDDVNAVQCQLDEPGPSTSLFDKLVAHGDDSAVALGVFEGFEALASSGSRATPRPHTLAARALSIDDSDDPFACPPADNYARDFVISRPKGNVSDILDALMVLGDEVDDASNPALVEPWASPSGANPYLSPPPAAPARVFAGSASIVSSSSLAVGVQAPSGPEVPVSDRKIAKPRRRRQAKMVE
jgi:hypothetical protein